MKTIKLTRNTRIKGETVEAGKTLSVGKDITKADALLLINIKKAEVTKGEPKKDETMTTKNTDALVQKRGKKTQKGKGKK